MLPDDLIVASNQIFSRDHLVLKAIEQAKHFYSCQEYKQIISFGDGLWDYETSKNINIDFIGIGSKKLLDYGITSFFSDFKDVKLLELMSINTQTREYSDFAITSTNPISQEFIKRNILTFNQAAFFVRNLPYGRNENKKDLTTVFSDNRGTCSTKHALLKQLADENNFKGLQLIIGLFKMNSSNTPEISDTLKQYNLDFIPEAHNYLKFGNQILDVTKTNSKPSDFIDDLIKEIEISSNQITYYKVEYHKNYLEDWLANNKQIKYSLAELWAIREQCIQDLAMNQKKQLLQ